MPATVSAFKALNFSPVRRPVKVAKSDNCPDIFSLAAARGAIGEHAH